MISEASRQRAFLEAAEREFEPIEEFPGTSKPWRGIHTKCGREVTPRWNSVRSGNRVCIHCRYESQRGFKGPTEASRARAFNEAEAKGFHPLEDFPGTQRPWRGVHAACGSEVTPTWGNVRRGQGVCPNPRCRPAFIQSMKQALDEAAAKDFQPLEEFPGTSKPWRGIHLVCGRKVAPRWDHQRANPDASVCRYCSSQKLPPDQSKDRALEEAKILDFEPLEDFPGVGNPWRGIHTKCGREVSPRWNGIRSSGYSVCAWCANGWGDSERRALLEAAEQGFRPLVPFPGTKLPWKGIHVPCGSEVEPIWAHTGRLGRGVCTNCRYGQSEKRAHQEAQEAGFVPLEPFVGVNGPWRGIHLECGLEVSPWWSDVRKGKTVCVYCASGFTESKNRALEEAATKDFEPLEPFPGTTAKWRGIHLTCGREVSVRWQSIRRGNNVCRYCGGGGFDTNLPGSLYLLAHRRAVAIKIGISNNVLGRIRAHVQRGYDQTPLAIAHYPVGADAFVAERLIIEELRQQGYGPVDGAPSSGRTETAPLEAMHLALDLMAALAP